MAACTAVSAAFAPGAFAQSTNTVTSPDGKLAVTVTAAANGTITYRIDRAGKLVLGDSALGLTFDGADLASKLKPAGATAIKPVSDKYELAAGKRRHVSYAANERTWHYTNLNKAALDLHARRQSVRYSPY